MFKNRSLRTIVPLALIVLNIMMLVDGGLIVGLLLWQKNLVLQAAYTDKVAMVTQHLMINVALVSREMAHQVLAATPEEAAEQTHHIAKMIEALKATRVELEGMSLKDTNAEKVRLSLIQHVVAFKQDVDALLADVQRGDRVSAFQRIDSSEEREDKIAEEANYLTEKTKKMGGKFHLKLNTGDIVTGKQIGRAHV